jgi:hypothetical protein
LDDFTGLESLKQIGTDDMYNSAYSYISSATEDFTGLDSLQKWYGAINIFFNNFSGFQGLDMLNEIGELELYHCNNVANFEGLNTVTKAKDIRVSYCNNFLNTSGVNGLDSLTSLEFNDLPLFNSVEGFSNLTDLGRLYINRCDALTSLNGFQSLQSINHILALRENPVLTSIDSLKYTDLSGLNYLAISNNPLLEVCSIDGVCNYLENNLGSFSIYSNGIGCNGTTEIEWDCNGQLFVFTNGSGRYMGNSDFFWHIASNWRNNQIPGPDSWVIIPPNVHCTVEENTVAECQILDLREGGNITVRDGATLTVFGE